MDRYANKYFIINQVIYIYIIYTYLNVQLNISKYYSVSFTKVCYEHIIVMKSA